LTYPEAERQEADMRNLLLRRSLRLTAALFLLSPLSTRTALAAISDDLVAHWSFDEGSGSTAGDSAGAISDDGTLKGGVSWTTGVTGGALDFDGVDGRVEVPISSDLNLTNGASISLWVNPDTNTVDLHWFVTTFSAGGYYLRVDNVSSPPNRGIDFYAGGGLRDQQFPPNGSWTHLAGTFDRTTGVTTLYVNNCEVASQQTCGPAPCGPGSPVTDLTIGRSLIGGGTGEFDGQLDEIYIHDRALSHAEVGQLVLGLGDTDCDTVPDAVDNCVFLPNGAIGEPPGALVAQCDTDGDGWGNACDPDVDNSGVIGGADYAPITANFALPGFPLPEDVNCDGVVGGADYAPITQCFTRAVPCPP
jgi:hypothetical protein